MEAINDEVISAMMQDDLVERGYTKEAAEIWTAVHGYKVVDDMWNAYTNYIEANSSYLKDD